MQPKRQPPLLTLHSSTSVGGAGKQTGSGGGGVGPQVRTLGNCPVTLSDEGVPSRDLLCISGSLRWQRSHQTFTEIVKGSLACGERKPLPILSIPG